MSGSGNRAGWRGSALSALSAVVVLAGLPGAVSAAQEPLPSSEVRVSDEWEINVFLCTPVAEGCGKRYATAAQKRAVRRVLEGRRG
ncbi:hypothetical protein [Nonomuraea sp. NPDC050643]|uniref:hypothetical protein n=1 Tax=Nonomuraea sp. NPDC050643 TaxID=3155660 RepID=UPI0033F22127